VGTHWHLTRFTVTRYIGTRSVHWHSLYTGTHSVHGYSLGTRVLTRYTGTHSVHWHSARPPRANSGLGEHNVLPPPPPSKGEPAKNLYTQSERLTLSCRLTLARSERVNLHSRQTVIPPRETQNIQELGPVICTGFPPLAPAWFGYFKLHTTTSFVRMHPFVFVTVNTDAVISTQHCYICQPVLHVLAQRTVIRL